MSEPTNVKATVKGNILTLTIDLTAATEPSKSGKSEVLASTKGFAEVIHNNVKYRYGLNVIK